MNQRDPAEAKEGNLFLNWESNCAVFTSSEGLFQNIAPLYFSFFLYKAGIPTFTYLDCIRGLKALLVLDCVWTVLSRYNARHTISFLGSCHI